jgi:molecular chaperone GrpE (heat shock protein)
MDMIEAEYHWPVLADPVRRKAESGDSIAEIKQALESAIAELSGLERSLYRSEKDEFVRWKRQWCRYRDGYQSLFAELPILIGRTKAVVASLSEDGLFGEAPAEVQSLLRNRREGLEIVCRMLGRLNARQPLIEKQVSADVGKLEQLRASALLPDVEASQVDEKEFVRSVLEAIEAIGAQERETRDGNYRATRRLKQNSEELKQALCALLRDHLLSVVDGLERGVWDEKQLLESIGCHEASPGLLAKWFGAYRMSYRLLKVFLKKIGLHCVGVKRGDAFDPQYHMALGHERCAELEDGQVFEVVRSGWRYQGELIRAAEVLVARNEGDGSNGRSSQRG